MFLNWAATKEEEYSTRILLKETVFILPKEEDRLHVIGVLSEYKGRLVPVMEVYKNMLVKDDHNNKLS